MRGVEGDVIAESILSRQGVRLVAWNALAHATVGVDSCRDAVVGVAKNPAAILNGAHARHVQVLPGSAGVSVPGVVADVDQHLGAEAGELADLVGKDRFITDEDSVAVTVQEKDLALLAAIEPGDFSGEFAGEEKQLLERNILTERNEVNLVVAAGARTV